MLSLVPWFKSLVLFLSNVVFDDDDVVVDEIFGSFCMQIYYWS